MRDFAHVGLNRLLSSTRLQGSPKKLRPHLIRFQTFIDRTGTYCAWLPHGFIRIHRIF
jgi:hypothetical protein